MPTTPAELYALAPTETLPADGLVVIGGMSCPLCSASMRNTDYATATANGTPITWLNIDGHTPGNYVFYSIPGVEYRADEDLTYVGGKPLAGLPAVLWLQDGKITKPAVKYGEITRGEFEMVLGKALVS